MAVGLVLIIAAAVQGPNASVPGTTPNLASQTITRDGGRPFMSPMGEPFFGRTPREDGLVTWFEQVDRNHDGAITVDEMTADADRFFRTLDTNHDGEIDPDEISHYERFIAPEVRRGPLTSRNDAASDGAEQSSRSQGRSGGRHERGLGGRGGAGFGGGRGGGGGDGFGGDDEAAGGRYGLLEIPEPVASADSDFNRGVSMTEFRNAAVARFRLLDISQTGRLTLPELENIRRAAASASRRPPKRSNDEDQSPESD